MLSLCWATSSIPPELIPVLVLFCIIMASILAMGKLAQEQKIDEAAGGEVRVFHNWWVADKRSLSHLTACFQLLIFCLAQIYTQTQCRKALYKRMLATQASLHLNVYFFLDGMLCRLFIVYSWVERGTVRIKCLAENTTQWPGQGTNPDHMIQSPAHQLTITLPLRRMQML